MTREGSASSPPGQVLMRSGVSLLGAARWRLQLHKSDLEGFCTLNKQIHERGITSHQDGGGRAGRWFLPETIRESGCRKRKERRKMYICFLFRFVENTKEFGGVISTQLTWQWVKFASKQACKISTKQLLSRQLCLLLCMYFRFWVFTEK